MSYGDGNAPDVSIIIPAWRLRQELRECLDAIERDHEGPSFEVIVVVNGANPEVMAVAESHPVVSQVIPLAENVGFGWACNVGAQAAQGRYLVFLNDDTQVQLGWRAALVGAAEQHRAAVVGSVLLSDADTVQEAGVRMLNDGEVHFLDAGVKLDDPNQQLADRTVDYASGAALLIDAQVFRELGGFDAAFMPAYYEDTDLQFRIKALGRDVWMAAGARVLHQNNRSTRGLESFREFAIANSKAHFMSRWGNVIRKAGTPDDAGTSLLAVPQRTGLIGSLAGVSAEPEVVRAKAADIQRNYTIWLEAQLHQQGKELETTRARVKWLDGELAERAAEVQTLDTRLQGEIADLEQRQRDQIADLEQHQKDQIASITQEREEQIRAINAAHAQQLQDLTETQERQLEAAAQQRTQDLEAATQAYAQEREAAAQTHAQELESVRQAQLTEARELENATAQNQVLQTQITKLADDLKYWREYGLDTWGQRMSQPGHGGNSSSSGGADRKRVAELEQEVGHLNQVLAEELAKKDDHIMHLNREIEVRDHRIDELNQEVAYFQNSVSWRVTSPLRTVRQAQRRS